MTLIARGASRENDLEEKQRDANVSNAQVKNSEGNTKGKRLRSQSSAKIGGDLRGLLENLADDKPVVRTNDKDEPMIKTR